MDPQNTLGQAHAIWSQILTKDQMAEIGLGKEDGHQAKRLKRVKHQTPKRPAVNEELLKMVARLALRTETTRTFLTEHQGNLPYLRWETSTRTLKPTSEAPLSLQEVVREVENVHRLVQDPTTTLRFHSLTKASDSQDKTLPWLWQEPARSVACSAQALLACHLATYPYPTETTVSRSESFGQEHPAGDCRIVRILLNPGSICYISSFMIALAWATVLAGAVGDVFGPKEGSS